MLYLGEVCVCILVRCAYRINVYRSSVEVVQTRISIFKYGLKVSQKQFKKLLKFPKKSVLSDMEIISSCLQLEWKFVCLVDHLQNSFQKHFRKIVLYRRSIEELRLKILPLPYSDADF